MPKQNLPENIAKLKFNLDKGNNLVDYFVICGVDPSICLDDTLYNTENIDLLLNKEIKAEILSKCPTFDKSIISIDEGILDYCFPKGFKIIYTRKQPNMEYFSFILDNNLYSFDHPQKYVTCLLFYECLKKYKDLKNKIENKNDTYSVLNDNESEMSTYTEFNNKKNDLDISIYSKSNLSLLNENPNLIHNFSKTVNKKTVNKIKYFYIPKCICFVSIYPFLNYHKILLENIFRYTQNNVQIPIEKIIQNLIIEVPVPPKGLYSIEYSLFNRNLSLINNPPNKLPSIHFNLKYLFIKLNIEQIFEILRNIYFEHKILFFSKHLHSLCNIILSFLTLIYPLKYPFQVISYLPKHNYNILESISPYIFGINENYSETFFEDNNLDMTGVTIFCVDIDNKSYKLFTNEKLPKLPNKIQIKYEKEIKQYLNSYKKLELINEKEEIKFNEGIFKNFFDFNIEILKGFYECLNKKYFSSNENFQNTNINTLFKVDEFINNHSSNEKSFYTKFVNDSQMFADFIYKTMIPKNNSEIIDILLIKDEIIDVTNRDKIFGKENLNFLPLKNYNIIYKYYVPKTLDLTQNEKDILINSDVVTLLKKGQFIENNYNRLIMKYYLFPCLNLECFFSNNCINDYIPPPVFSEEIDAINIDIISTSKLTDIQSNLNLEMLNNIYLTWLELWSFSFWYLKKEERKFWFDEMLKVLDKVIHHEMEIFNLLFDTLSKQNEDEMILKLYQKLITKKLNVTSFIYSIISKLLDRKQIEQLINDKMKNNKDFYFNDPYSFPCKRTKKTISEGCVLTENIYFYKYNSCSECTESINVYNLSKNFEDMKKDEMWAKCEHCNEYILPKIIVKFGKDLNTQGIFNGIVGKTSTIEEVVLHSPYNLKINIKNGLLNEYGINLDIEHFKIQFTSLFWNVIWYFSLNNLNYDFIFPHYYKDLDERKIKNDNNIRVSFIHNIEIEKENNKEKLNKKNKIKEKKFKLNKLSINLENEISYIKKTKDFNLEAYLDSSKIVSIKDLKNKIYKKYNSLKSEDGINPTKLLDNTVNYEELSRITELDSTNENFHSKKIFEKLYSINEE